MLRVSAVLAIAGATVAAGFACVDPEGDYQEYVDRTNTMRGVVPDGGQSDAPAFEVGDADLDAGRVTYLASCMPNLIAGSPQNSLLFYAEVTFTGGTLDMENFPLKETATKFLKSETVGSPMTAKNVTVNADNSFSANIGAAKIPGNSQRIGDSELVLASVVFNGKILGRERLCAEMQGQSTAPIAMNFDEPGDICIWVEVAEGADLPKAKDSSGADFYGFSNESHRCP